MLIGVATFLVLIIALLAVPITLTFKLSWRQAIQGDIELRWLFGLVRVRPPAFGSRPPLTGNGQGKRQTGHPGRSSGSKRNAFAVVRQKSFRRRVIRFIGDCWHAVGKRNLILHLRVGLGDPADTGQLWGMVGPVAGMLASTREASIEIVPEFSDATFELDSSGDIRLVPLQMIYLAAGLLLSPSVWQGIKYIRSSN